MGFYRLASEPLSNLDAGESVEPTAQVVPITESGLDHDNAAVADLGRRAQDSNSVLQLGADLSKLTFEELVPLGTHTKLRNSGLPLI